MARGRLAGQRASHGSVERGGQRLSLSQQPGVREAVSLTPGAAGCRSRRSRRDGRRRSVRHATPRQRTAPPTARRARPRAACGSPRQATAVKGVVKQKTCRRCQRLINQEVPVPGGAAFRSTRRARWRACTVGALSAFNVPVGGRQAAQRGLTGSPAGPAGDGAPATAKRPIGLRKHRAGFGGLLCSSPPNGTSDSKPPRVALRETSDSNQARALSHGNTLPLCDE